jgi:hypothetical protein
MSSFPYFLREESYLFPRQIVLFLKIFMSEHRIRIYKIETTRAISPFVFFI